ncbi:hypothetical protein IC757_10560 [Wenzhouxiangella sp. AB-CW3]|uniref:hypothetical protein n=1 Tax=Wenzhouxiangella sp. AB-CW3 TaxID=2771012 RepID=UPI00168B90D6|nr:hypothetical protein [Wenzhouxiangella sp. AB-CW3]QOC21495.1 hypothetical protein IC757_10560 [Wenzhouxiangella sp. AB-CW3]
MWNAIRAILALVAITLASTAWSSCNLSSARIGNILIKIGDTERRVIQADPDREVQLESQQGGAAGFRFDFHQRDVTIQVYVRSGRVTRICHLRG